MSFAIPIALFASSLVLLLALICVSLWLKLDGNEAIPVWIGNFAFAGVLIGLAATVFVGIHRVLS